MFAAGEDVIDPCVANCESNCATVVFVNWAVNTPLYAAVSLVLTFRVVPETSNEAVAPVDVSVRTKGDLPNGFAGVISWGMVGVQFVWLPDGGHAPPVPA